MNIIQNDYDVLEIQLNTIQTDYDVLYQRYGTNIQNLQQQLDMCKNDLLLSDLQLDTKWGKWKRRFKEMEVRFNNLQRLPPQPVNQVWLLLQ